MREVLDRCPRCGGEVYRQVDDWSGETMATRDRLCASCRAGAPGSSPSLPPVVVASPSAQQSAVGPLLLVVGLVGAPVIAALELILR